ncbi:MAG: type II toxin-antitoxin system HicA family toxin [Saprospiraceae bacterium]|nr:type II toxin-antitoxin system HicA family toxin [Candidatus Vicinibacter affinis]
MRQISGKEFCRILESNGWILKRINGSHFIFSKPNFNVRISVPVHGNNPLKIGLLKSLLKVAHIEEDSL